MLTSWLIYIAPAIGWGLMPVIAKKAGGTPKQQLFGTTIIALTISFFLGFVYRIDYRFPEFYIAMLSGVFWSIGQLLLFEALKKSNVSRVIPVSNGSQLIFTTLFSGIILYEWKSINEAFISILMLLMMIVAVKCITQKDPMNHNEKKLVFSTILLIVFSSSFLTAYVTICSFFGISGFEILFPQSIGMFLCALLILITDKKSAFCNKYILRNFITGISWVVANIALFYSSPKIGVGLSFSISQMCIFVSVLCGIVFLREKKTRKELAGITVGMILFLFALIVLSLQK